MTVDAYLLLRVVNVYILVTCIKFNVSAAASQRYKCNVCWSSLRYHVKLNFNVICNHFFIVIIIIFVLPTFDWISDIHCRNLAKRCMECVHAKIQISFRPMHIFPCPCRNHKCHISLLNFSTNQIFVSDAHFFGFFSRVKAMECDLNMVKFSTLHFVRCSRAEALDNCGNICVFQRFALHRREHISSWKHFMANNNKRTKEKHLGF